MAHFFIDIYSQQLLELALQSCDFRGSICSFLLRSSHGKSPPKSKNFLTSLYHKVRKKYRIICSYPELLQLIC